MGMIQGMLEGPEPMKDPRHMQLSGISVVIFVILRMKVGMLVLSIERDRIPRRASTSRRVAVCSVADGVSSRIEVLTPSVGDDHVEKESQSTRTSLNYDEKIEYAA